MDNLESIANQAQQNLAARDTAREKMLPLCREVIRCSGNAIRAIHRQEYQQAKKLLNTACTHMANAQNAVTDFSELTGTGAIRDAQKELSEAHITLAIVTGQLLPTPEELEIDTAAYLNGMGEAAGEIRRYMLDAIRKGDLSRGEELLTIMDDIYNVLITMDFPDAITGGLRRTTDMVRGVLERTRSDLTLSIQQKALEDKLSVLKNERVLQSEIIHEDAESETLTASETIEPELNSNEDEIYQSLVNWRTRRSNEENIAPYIIARNSTLKEIIKLHPVTVRDLYTVKNFGEKRANKYGKEIIAIIEKRLKK